MAREREREKKRNTDVDQHFLQKPNKMRYKVKKQVKHFLAKVSSYKKVKTSDAKKKKKKVA